MEFKGFKWLLSIDPVREKRFPVKNALNNWSILNNDDLECIRVGKAFYSEYIRPFGMDYIVQRVNTIKNPYARAWASMAIEKIDEIIQYANDEFLMALAEVQSDISIVDLPLESIFKPYMPFMTERDYFEFAIANRDNESYRYFYILLLVLYKDDYPYDLSTRYEKDFWACKKRNECHLASKCSAESACILRKQWIGLDYTVERELIEYEYEIVSFLMRVANYANTQTLIKKLFVSFKQINETGLFQDKLILSVDKVLGFGGFPLTGIFFIPWEYIEFCNGYFLVKHPKRRAIKDCYYRVEEPISQVAFNDLTPLFKKHLSPLLVQAKEGAITNIINKSDIRSCVEWVEQKIYPPKVERTQREPAPKLEKKIVSTAEVKALNAELKSRYIDFLCDKQLPDFKVVCFIEHRVNSNGQVSSEYAFLFTIQEADNKLCLAYENASNSRCTYLFPIRKGGWQEAVDNLYNYFASNEINKRQQLASRTTNLKLPGDYAYYRIMHTNFLSWVEKIKYGV